MRAAAAIVAAVMGTVIAVVVTTSSCSLFVSTEEFAGGQEAPDANVDATVVAPAEAGVDGGGGPLSDSGSGDDGGEVTEVGLLAYWRLDEGTGLVAKDSTPNHHDGVLISNAAWTPMGKVNGAITFDAAKKSYVRVQTTASLEVTTTFSLAWWMNPLGLEAPDDPRVYAHGYQFDVKINGTRPQLTVGGHYDIADFYIGSNAWHHYVVTFDRGKIGWYVDGGLKQTEATTFVGGETPPTMDVDIRIGMDVGSTWPFTGTVDEVRVYSRVITPTEIAKLAGQ